MRVSLKLSMNLVRVWLEKPAYQNLALAKSPKPCYNSIRTSVLAYLALGRHAAADGRPANRFDPSRSTCPSVPEVPRMGHKVPRMGHKGDRGQVLTRSIPRALFIEVRFRPGDMVLCYNFIYPRFRTALLRSTSVVSGHS